MRRVLCVLVFLTAVVSLNASNIRVNQMGESWLVPDEFMDFVVNPAKATEIDGNRAYIDLNMKLSEDYHKSEYALDDYESKQVNNNFESRTMLLNSFDNIVVGVVLDTKVKYTTDGSSNNRIRWFLDGLFGLKISDILSIGLNSEFNDSDSIFSMNMGVNFEDDKFGLGVVLGAGKSFYYDNRNQLMLNVLPVFKLDNGDQIRTYMMFRYHFLQLRYNNLPEKYLGTRFYDKYVDNKAGASYISNYNSINTIFGIGYDWDIVVDTYKCYSTEKVWSDKNQIYVNSFVGLESEVFFEWLKFRVKYIYFSYAYTKNNLTMEYLNGISELQTYSSHSFVILPTDVSGIVFGVSIDLKDYLTIDLNLSKGNTANYYFSESENDGGYTYNDSFYLYSSGRMSLDFSVTVKY